MLSRSIFAAVRQSFRPQLRNCSDTAAARKETARILSHQVQNLAGKEMNRVVTTVLTVAMAYVFYKVGKLYLQVRVDRLEDYEVDYDNL